MLEGKIKLHGHMEECVPLLQDIETVLKSSRHSDLKVVCKVQEPGKPDRHVVTFKKPVGDAGPLSANWNI